METEIATRDEYFLKIYSLFYKYFRASDKEEINIKEKIISISYDVVVSTRNEKEQLEKRVEELENGIREMQRKYTSKDGNLTGHIYDEYESLLNTPSK